MNIKIKTGLLLVVLASVLFSFSGCKIYSLSGASISPEARTVSIPFFPNSAPMVAATLSSTFTDALQQRFSNRTRLMLVPADGDLAFEGEIVGYTLQPMAVTADEFAAMQRLTITVRVRFTNEFQSEYNFDRTFSHYYDFPADQVLQSVEANLIPTIVEKLVDDIFNAAVSNW